MPKRDDLSSILLIGSGPIVIGQACEFDYSGTQGAKALRQEGYRVILVNSNPATIMTDPEFADRTYIEPLVPEVLEMIIEKERPDAVLPTLGGQTALNLALALEERGILEKYNVELLGARVDVIRKAEDRERFKQAMEKLGLSCPKARTVSTLAQAEEAVQEVGFPVILRPSFTMGGSGGGIAYNREEFDKAIRWAFQESPTHECLVEESVLGWKEFELEVMRDCADNFIVVCTIENFDPMGVHTGDSLTVAPAMTLTDKEYQRMREAAKAIIREIGVETGGANIQFAVEPSTGRLVVVEMNPRVSRSSALASKATGYPIAKIAAKLAVGYTLDELRNDITQTSAAFEPTIDYVVCKVPRFAFEKFEGADPRLGTQMKSVGEAMSIGRTFQEALSKALRSLEVGRPGLVTLLDRLDYPALAMAVRRMREHGEAIRFKQLESGTVSTASVEELQQAILEVVRTPLGERIWYLADGLRVGLSVASLVEATGIDPWFLDQIASIVRCEAEMRATQASLDLTGKLVLAPASLAAWKLHGFSDAHIASVLGRPLPGFAGAGVVGAGGDETHSAPRLCRAEDVRALRMSAGIHAGFGRVDTCSAEFETHTPYMYSSARIDEAHLLAETAAPASNTVMILGGGPNRIGQGIEFDYCCVHASFALRELGFETVMVNCNPETVSTDYDISDRLYFEPLTFEDVMRIVEVEKPIGVIVQFGGQTPINLALALDRAGVKLLGTPAEAIDRAEDREKFEALLESLSLRRPRGGIAHGMDEAFDVAERIGYPVVVRPSYVLGGRGMEVVHSKAELSRYFAVAFEAVRDLEAPTILIDEFLRDAIEVDVDCVSDGRTALVAGIMQHIEEAGVHSGDSSVVLPPHALPPEVLGTIRSSARSLALELGVVGLMNVQFAVRGSAVYVIEVNPRASRTVPFVSKATGLPLARIATSVMVGKTLAEAGFHHTPEPAHVAVKESVFPFKKFPGVDTILSPEMRSTGEVMGIAKTLPEAFYKALLASGTVLPTSGMVFISVRDQDKPGACDLASRLVEQGFTLIATQGTATALHRAGIRSETVRKVAEGRPHVVDRLRDGDVCMVINSTEGAQAIMDSRSLRHQTLLSGIPYFTTLAAATAAVSAIESSHHTKLEIKALQDYHVKPCLRSP